MTKLDPLPGEKGLTPLEQGSLEAACDTLFPSLAPEPGDDPILFGLCAKSVGLAPSMAEAILQLDPVRRTQFRLLLRILDSRLLALALIGEFKRFRDLSLGDREQFLLAMARSRWSPLRQGFQALKRLAAFLFYSLPDAHGDNPTWKPLTYIPSAKPTPALPGLKLENCPPAKLECDVCVVGSGAGGSVVAAELAAAGKKVIVVEAGPGLQAPDFEQRERWGMRDLYLEQGMAASTDLGMTLLAGGCLGGGTTVNWQTCLPLPLAIREEWAAKSQYRFFAEESFSRSLDAVMSRLNAGTTESVINPNNGVLQRGCQKLGYRWEMISRNSKSCDCTQCGYCVFGCRLGSKQSTAITFLADAQRNGDATILPNCRAEKVLRQGSRVEGVQVLFSDPTSGQQRSLQIRSKVVVVAAGSLHSPLLLQRSGIRLKALGNYLFLHPTSAVSGLYEERTEPWVGPPQTILCNEFAQTGGDVEFRLETAPTHPGMMAMSTSWQNARIHRRRMQKVAHSSPIIVLARDLEGGRVRSGAGGRPLVDYRPGVREQGSLRRGIAEAARVHFAAGALSVSTLHSPEFFLQRKENLTSDEIDAFCNQLENASVGAGRSTLFSAHQMGTCRMGKDPATAVCDERGEVFGTGGLFIADASAFPASSGVNPMITIMALAHHTAQAIKRIF